MFFSHEDTGTLWSAHRLSTGYRNKIKTHVVELPEIFHRRHVSCDVDHRGEVVFLRYFHPFLVLYAAFRCFAIKKPKHGGLFVYGALKLLSRFYKDKLNAG